MKKYQHDPSVEYVEPNNIFTMCTTPNDPLLPDQWALQNTGQTGGTPDADIDAPEAWDIETGDSHVVVAVIDTGVNYHHVDLKDNIWINPGEDVNHNGFVDQSDFNGIDDDGNGYVDDLRGWNFAYNNNDPLDEIGHGTHCAGIASAMTNNSIGISGVCWNSTIMPLKIVNQSGFASFSDTAASIIYATNCGADIISMSFAFAGESYLLKDAIDYAYEHGVILVAAAGNAGMDLPVIPALYDNVIAVAATGDNDERASFSSFGEWVDVAAPGVDILSTFPNDTYGVLSGTSMSCPCVAGLAALLLSKNHSISNEMVRTIIENTVDTIHSNFSIGRGRINAYQAIKRDSALLYLNSFPDKDDIKGIINITGTAWGERFEYYTLEMNKGRNHDPATWIQLKNSTIPVHEDCFITIDTTMMDEGTYTFRLKMICSDGSYEDEVTIVVNNQFNEFFVDANNTIGPWDGTSEHPYLHIQDGIDCSGRRDEVYIHHGSYFENLLVDREIKVLAENPFTTFIIGLPSQIGIDIKADNVTVRGCTIQNNRYGICTNFNTGTTLYDNQVINNSDGILLFGGQKNNISHNIISRNKDNNIRIFSSIENEICNNTFSDSRDSLSLYTCFKTSITENNFVHNRNGATIGSGSSDITISSNTIQENEQGILLQGSINTSILTNIIWGNSAEGILVDSHSNAVISENTIQNNSYGIYLFGSHYNRVFHNNLIDNRVNGFDYTSNYWDDGYPSGGNYWSNFDEPDEGAWDNNSDGIIDSSYMIPPWSNSQDHFPFLHKDGWANSQPYPPTDPNPANNATEISVYTTLSWVGGDPNIGDSVTYDVYFGTTIPPPKKASNLTNSIYNITGPLLYTTSYYWKVITRDNHGTSTTGPLWSFTTEKLSDTTPPIIQIIKPKDRYLYRHDTEIRKRIFFKNTFIIGKITVSVDAKDNESGISSVEIWIDGHLKTNDTTAPYTYLWLEKKVMPSLHHIKIVAYNTIGLRASKECVVKKFL